MKKIDKGAVLDMLKKKWGDVVIGDDVEDKVIYLLDHHISKIDSYIKAVDKYLRMVSTRDRLVKDCCRVLNSDWIEFDNNEYLLAFENRVYDLELGKWVNPRYDQYISLTTGWKMDTRIQQ